MLNTGDPLPIRPRRVLVAGVGGCGKTTLAGRIAAVTGGPHKEIDALFHGPNWIPRPEFLDDVRALVQSEAWTTEWQYSAARPILAARADLLLWLDLPFWRVTFPRILRRTTHRRWHRTRLWNGNVEPPLSQAITDPEHIIRWAVRTRRKYATIVPALQVQEPHLTMVRLRTDDEVEAWLAGPLQQSCHP